MLQGSDLVCVRGDRRLFRDVNFSLDAGGLMQVSGPNGSGKTSLLRMLCGLSAPAHGEIRWCGKTTRSLGVAYSRALTYLGHLNGNKDDLTAIENLRISSALAGVEIDDKKARDALQYIGLKGRELLPVKVLSQGQKKRVALARLLVSDTALWILDEPLAALDIHAIDLIKDLLEKHLAQGGMLVMTTHQEINIAAAATQKLRLA
jgi:heme exporter protein A